jgi:ligand-binding SRPBCC domain-containing protein
VNPPRFSRTPEGLFKLETELWLPRRRDEVFRFFAVAFNLETLTPPWLKFEVLTPRPIEMRAGLRIDYRLRLRGFPLRWQSEIIVWEPPGRFVDEQRHGPYRQWIHEHTFEERDGGTLARDMVQYAVIGGRLINTLFVRRDVEKILRFRREKLRELFA